MGRAASMAKDMPEEKMPHMTASSSPFFTSNSRISEPNAISLRCPAIDTMTMPQSATAMPKSVSRPPRVLTSSWRLTVDERRNQRSHHQGDADGHSDAERHAEISHGEAVAHVADSPHTAKEKSLENDGRVKRPVEGSHIRQQYGADTNRQKNPGERCRPPPRSIPRSTASLC